MHFDKFSFGSVQIDGSRYQNDVVIDCGEVRKRKKKPSKQFCKQFGHTPLSIEEDISWKCSQLVIGTGAYGQLPVMQEVRGELILPKTGLIAHYFTLDPAPQRRLTLRCLTARKLPSRQRRVPFNLQPKKGAKICSLA